MHLYQLPDRFVRGAGQGGGGALSISQLKAALRIESASPVLLPESILHTDSAKAYKCLGPLHWLEPDVLVETDVWEGRERFSAHL